MINHTTLSLEHQKNCSLANERMILCIDQNGKCNYNVDIPDPVICIQYFTYC